MHYTRTHTNFRRKRNFNPYGSQTKTVYATLARENSRRVSWTRRVSAAHYVIVLYTYNSTPYARYSLDIFRKRHAVRPGNQISLFMRTTMCV